MEIFFESLWEMRNLLNFGNASHSTKYFGNAVKKVKWNGNSRYKIFENLVQDKITRGLSVQPKIPELSKRGQMVGTVTLKVSRKSENY